LTDLHGKNNKGIEGGRVQIRSRGAWNLGQRAEESISPGEKTPKKRKTAHTKDKLNFLVRKLITISSGRSSLVLHLHNKRKNL
jgi:hypothetical protein